MPKLIKHRHLTDDDWTLLAPSQGEAPLRLPAGPVAVPLDVWLSQREDLIRRGREYGEPLGLSLATDQDPGAIAGDLNHISLIAVHFASFADGRGYSTARLLRERHGYAGELRAWGDIGQDQLYFLARVGFDSFVIKEDGAEALRALAAFSSFPECYQAAVDTPLPLYRRRGA